MMEYIGRLPLLQRQVGVSDELSPQTISPPPPMRTRTDFLNPDDSSRPDFTIEDAETATEKLDKIFDVLIPDECVCLRRRYGRHYTHCPHGIGLGQRNVEIQGLLRRRSQLLLVRDYTTRIAHAMGYLRFVQCVAQEECKLWYELSRGHEDVFLKSHLEDLNAICEELRAHMNHWGSIKHRVQTDPWLRLNQGELLLDLDHVRHTVWKLRDSTIRWVEYFINVGLRVFAHTTLKQVNEQTLWSVTRGIEEYNILLEQARQLTRGESEIQLSHSAQLIREGFVLHSNPPSLKMSNSSATCLEHCRRVQVANVLILLVRERAKISAKHLYGFLTYNDDFISISNAATSTRFDWREHFLKTNLKSPTSSTENIIGTPSLESEGSEDSSAYLLKVGDFTAPDLSVNSSPLFDFCTHESVFIGQFLTSMATNTNMIRQPMRKSDVHIVDFKPRSSKSPPKTSVNAENLDLTHPAQTSPITTAPTSGNPGSEVKNTDEPIRINVQSESRKENASKRKTVRWTDSVDMNAVTHLRGQYFELLWQNFGSHLLELFFKPLWIHSSINPDCIGHIIQLNPVIVLIIVQMLEQVSVKDLFPADVVNSLRAVVRGLQATIILSSWDSAYCEALACSLTDKFNTLDVTVGSNTSLTLQQSMYPLISLFETIADDLPKLSENIGANCSVGFICNHSVIHLSLAMLPLALNRFIFTLVFTINWFNRKIINFLSNWNIGPFMLITQTDLKVFTSLISRVLQLCQLIMGHVELMSDSFISHDIECLYQTLSLKASELHSLSSSSSALYSQCSSKLCTTFFKTSLPTAKSWRINKTNKDVPTSASDYTDSLIYSILEPVTEGVSPLKSTVQISAVSIVLQNILEAWMNKFLKEKIKFSIHGAEQLQVDINSVREWLDSQSGLTEQARHSVVNLEMYTRVAAIIDILMDQPHRSTTTTTTSTTSTTTRTANKHKGSHGELVSEYGQSTNTTNLLSPCTNLSHSVSAPTLCDIQTSNSTSTAHNIPVSASCPQSKSTTPVGTHCDSVGNVDDQLRTLPDRSAWMNLRLHTSSGRRWKFFLTPCYTHQDY